MGELEELSAKVRELEARIDGLSKMYYVLAGHQILESLAPDLRERLVQIGLQTEQKHSE